MDSILLGHNTDARHTRPRPRLTLPCLLFFFTAVSSTCLSSAFHASFVMAFPSFPMHKTATQQKLDFLALNNHFFSGSSSRSVRHLTKNPELAGPCRYPNACRNLGQFPDFGARKRIGWKANLSVQRPKYFLLGLDTDVFDLRFWRGVRVGAAGFPIRTEQITRFFSCRCEKTLRSCQFNKWFGY